MFVSATSPLVLHMFNFVLDQFYLLLLLFLFIITNTIIIITIIIIIIIIIIIHVTDLRTMYCTFD